MSKDKKKNKHENPQEQNASSSSEPTSLQVDTDKETGNWTVHPKQEPAKWMVECDSKNDANTLRNEISSGKAKAPTEDPQHYSTPRRHSNGKTLVYFQKAS